MPRVTPNAKLERLTDLASEQQEGLGIKAIAPRLDNSLLRRTYPSGLASNR